MSWENSGRKRTNSESKTRRRTRRREPAKTFQSRALGNVSGSAERCVSEKMVDEPVRRVEARHKLEDQRRVEAGLRDRLSASSGSRRDDATRRVCRDRIHRERVSQRHGAAERRAVRPRGSGPALRWAKHDRQKSVASDGRIKVRGRRPVADGNGQSRRWADGGLAAAHQRVRSRRRGWIERRATATRSLAGNGRGRSVVHGDGRLEARMLFHQFPRPATLNVVSACRLCGRGPVRDADRQENGSQPSRTNRSSRHR
jgi:hypothetical protein